MSDPSADDQALLDRLAALKLSGLQLGIATYVSSSPDPTEMTDRSDKDNLHHHTSQERVFLKLLRALKI